MRFSEQMTDDALLEELGARVAGARIERNLSQAVLAERAGLSKRTVERLEAGAVGAQLSSFVRVCRVLGLIERLDMLVAEPVVSPIAQLDLQGKRRRRASRQRTKPRPTKKWTWGEA